MAKAPRLSVYVTPAGFYDAVVAAPNQKAALASWGVHANLFAEGAAKSEDDPEWREKALARPGEVIRKPRGDTAALLAQPAPKASKTKAKAQTRKAPPSAPPPPPADRGPLTKAEAALAQARTGAERAAEQLEERRRALDDEAAEARATWETREAELEQAVAHAQRAFLAAGGKL